MFCSGLTSPHTAPLAPTKSPAPCMPESPHLLQHLHLTQLLAGIHAQRANRLSAWRHLRHHIPRVGACEHAMTGACLLVLCWLPMQWDEGAGRARWGLADAWTFLARFLNYMPANRSRARWRGWFGIQGVRLGLPGVWCLSPVGGDRGDCPPAHRGGLHAAAHARRAGLVSSAAAWSCRGSIAGNLNELPSAWWVT